MELDRARSSNGYGPNPLSFAEIEAWTRLRKMDLADWEIATLRALDAVRVAGVTEADAPPPVETKREMTPALFGALFAR